MEKAGPETKAAQLFQQGQYTEALQLYTTCIKAIPNFSRQDIKVNLLLNRSACYLKLVSMKFHLTHTGMYYSYTMYIMYAAAGAVIKITIQVEKMLCKYIYAFS